MLQADCERLQQTQKLLANEKMQFSLDHTKTGYLLYMIKSYAAMHPCMRSEQSPSMMCQASTHENVGPNCRAVVAVQARMVNVVMKSAVFSPNNELIEWREGWKPCHHWQRFTAVASHSMPCLIVQHQCQLEAGGL